LDAPVVIPQCTWAYWSELGDILKPCHQRKYVNPNGLIGTIGEQLETYGPYSIFHFWQQHKVVHPVYALLQDAVLLELGPDRARFLWCFTRTLLPKRLFWTLFQVHTCESKMATKMQRTMVVGRVHQQLKLMLHRLQVPMFKVVQNSLELFMGVHPPFPMYDDVDVVVEMLLARLPAPLPQMLLARTLRPAFVIKNDGNEDVHTLWLKPQALHTHQQFLLLLHRLTTVSEVALMLMHADVAAMLRRRPWRLLGDLGTVNELPGWKVRMVQHCLQKTGTWDAADLERIASRQEDDTNATITSDWFREQGLAALLDLSPPLPPDNDQNSSKGLMIRLRAFVGDPGMNVYSRPNRPHELFIAMGGSIRAGLCISSATTASISTNATTALLSVTGLMEIVLVSPEQTGPAQFMRTVHPIDVRSHSSRLMVGKEGTAFALISKRDDGWRRRFQEPDLRATVPPDAHRWPLNVQYAFARVHHLVLVTWHPVEAD
jgi:hypothetical protein